MLRSYPTLSWIRSQLRYNLIHSFRNKIIGAYIIGSEAKGTSNENSDIDIGVIINPVHGKTSLKLTEQYLQKFKDERHKPIWENRIIDFQFFYPDNIEIQEYQKIKIH